MKTVFEKLKVLEKTSGSNDKIALLKTYLKDPLFLKCTVYALDSRMTFNVKKFPKELVRPTGTVDDIFNMLDYLNHKDGAEKADKNKLFSLASQSIESLEVVKRICNKDLKCGIGVTSVNDAIPGTIFDIPYCRCSTDKKIDRIVYPAFVQEKADGTFCNAMLTSPDDIQFLTREGKPLLQLDKLREIIKKELPKEFYGVNLQGELRIKDPRTGKLLNRQTGNGILSSCLYGTADQNMVDNAVLCIWHCVPLADFWNHSSNIPYVVAFETAKTMCSLLADSGRIQLVRTQVVNSYEEAWEFYLMIRAEGGEGAIVKNFKFKWKYHTSTDQIKLKNVSEADLVIVGWYYATEGSKYDGMIGGFTMQTADGLLEVNVGGGYSDEQRKMNPDDKIGEIGSVLYESVIKSKGAKKYSLYLPRFKEFRFDRSKRNADTLQDLLER